MLEYEHIRSQQGLEGLCQRIRDARFVGFDTEFVSEDTYHPQLCLIQVAIERDLAIVDPFEIDDVTPFWEALAAPGHVTIVHAGREELRFCQRAVGVNPSSLFDAQIAAGLAGYEYPAAYATLITKVVGQRISKGETRTDWRRRPLSSRQLDYAAQDVVHLQTLYERLRHRLESLGRLDWIEEEMARWQQSVVDAESRERWRRTSGISGLNLRQLATVREIWRWRDAEAMRRDKPPRRILRDDLVVELARRQTADAKHIRAVRGFERRDYQRLVDDLAEAIQRSLDLPDEELPQRTTGDRRPELTLLGQFLSAALGALCRSLKLSPSLVGGAEDLRDLVSHRLNLVRFESPPALASGWRAEVIGKVIDDLLAGKMLLGIERPLDSQPLRLVPDPGGG